MNAIATSALRKAWEEFRRAEDWANHCHSSTRYNAEAESRRRAALARYVRLSARFGPRP